MYLGKRKVRKTQVKENNLMKRMKIDEKKERILKVKQKKKTPKPRSRRQAARKSKYTSFFNKS